MVAFGDDVPCLVLDVGSYNTRFGYAGEDLPRCVFPSIVAVLDDAMAMEDEAPNERLAFGQDALRLRQNALLFPLVKNSQWTNAKYLACLVKYAKQHILKIDEPMPLLVVESGENTAEAKRQFCDAIFDAAATTTDCFSAVYFARTPVAASFALGKHTSLVVDIGAEFTTVTPVVDGFVLKNNVCRSKIAGNWIAQKYADLLVESGYVPTIPACIRAKKPVNSGQLPIVEVRLEESEIAPTIVDFHRRRLFDDFKENCISVPDVMSIGADFKNIKHYEFPDGFNNSFDVGAIVDELFARAENAVDALPLDSKPISDVVHQCIADCDVDLRNALVSNIVLCGGTSLIAGLVERLSLDLSKFYSPSKLKFLALTNSYEKRFTSWIGGSILGSLGTFQQLWISKKEFQDQGAAIFNTKCL